MTSPLSFPVGFTFGAATSAFQIEGAWNAHGKGPSIWDTFTHTPGRVWRDATADVACDHYYRYRDDIALMRELGLDAYRFSISWPRVLPQGTGEVNEAGVDFYDRLVDELLAAGIMPSATLFHWDFPQALEDRGGWPLRESVDWFADYATVMFDRLGDRVAQWATLNEPISLWVGYGLGVFAPGRTDRAAARQAMHHALVGHGRAVQAFRASGAEGEIGVVVDIWKRHPATEDPADVEAARVGEYDGFRFFLDPLLTGTYDPHMLEHFASQGTELRVDPDDERVIAEPVDFLGLNVYSRIIESAGAHNDHWWASSERLPGGNYLDNGMEFYPRAVYDAVRLVTDEYGSDVSLYITENGVSDELDAAPGTEIDDAERITYLSGFLAWIARAIQEGADVRGYYVWSLLDNFEWAAGYSQRFGIVHVDWETLARTPKHSARWYQELLQTRTVPDTTSPS